jgi:hypothetical protein
MFTGEFYDLLIGLSTSLSTSKGSSDYLLINSDKKTLKMESKFDNIADNKSNRNIIVTGSKLKMYVPEKNGDPEAKDNVNIKLFYQTFILKQIERSTSQSQYMELISKKNINKRLNLMRNLLSLENYAKEKSPKSPEENTNDVVKELLSQE